MTDERNLASELIEEIEHDTTLNDDSKRAAIQAIHKTQKIKINMLITGATGCGKSSTINALFGSEKAKVGQTSNPETMDIQKYEYNNIILWDSPGLGDGKDDPRHAKNITNKLYEKNSNGEMLIDLVLVILDGGSRDLGTSFELINKVIIPNLGEDKKRLLIAINQADQAMKGRYWNYEKPCPEPKLVEFLEEKVQSTKNRIKEATGVNVEPIYYSAGYKDGEEEQKPYNLLKLLTFIVRHTPKEKRPAIVQDINKSKTVWQSNDKTTYGEEIVKMLGDAVVYAIEKTGDVILESLGKIETVITTAANVVSSVGRFFSRLF